jgi:hypothetical protein
MIQMTLFNDQKYGFENCRADHFEYIPADITG